MNKSPKLFAIFVWVCLMISKMKSTCKYSIIIKIIWIISLLIFINDHMYNTPLHMQSNCKKFPEITVSDFSKKWEGNYVE